MCGFLIEFLAKECLYIVCVFKFTSNIYSLSFACDIPIVCIYLVTFLIQVRETRYRHDRTFNCQVRHLLGITEK